MTFGANRSFGWALWLALAVPAALAGQTLPQKESLAYRVEWRLIHAGKAQLDWNAATHEGASGWQAGLRLESTGLVSKLFKVNDVYNSRLKGDLCAISSYIDAQEGRRHRETEISFDGAAGKANYLERDRIKNTIVLKKEIEIPPCVHDVVGALYKLRTLRLEPGQSTELPVSDGKKSVVARVEAQRREDVRTPAGSFKTVRYEAYLFNGVLYQRDARLYVWLTDDDRRLPVQIRVRLQFTVGTITLQLETEQRS
jgi:hypothetical protein